MKKHVNVVRCRKPSRVYRSRSGFTLVELLVVIGIIALLLGILIPVVGAARKQGYQVACASNVKQLTQAFLMYEKDNNAIPDGASHAVVPTGWDWIHWLPDPAHPPDQGRLVKYMGGTFVAKSYKCPMDDNVHTQVSSKFGNVHYPYSYSMNLRSIGMSLTQIVNASHKILLYEENDSINDGQYSSLSGTDHITSRHAKGTGNLGFFDGHVQPLTDVETDNDSYGNPTAP